MLTNISVVATNLGQVLHKFKTITLRVRGIKDEAFKYWEKKNELEPSLYAYFPHKIFETNLVKKNWNFIFIEPAVAQRINQITLIPIDYTYISAHVEFEYKEYWPHTAEAVFAIPITAQSQG